MSKPVNIVYLMDSYTTPNAGTESQFQLILHSLDRNCFRPVIALLRDSDYVRTHGFSCPYQVLGITRILSIRAIAKMFRFCLFLWKNNIKIAHLFFNDVTILAPLFLKLAGVKVIISRRDMGFWYNRYNLPVLRLNSLFVNHVIVNSHAVEAITTSKEWISSRKITVIYNGISNSYEDKISSTFVKNDDEKIIGMVSNIKPIKRIEDLIRAFSLIHGHLGLTRVVIAGGGDTGELKKLAVSLGVENQIMFLGQLKNTAPIIKNFDVGVLCSESEGFSNTIMEYIYLNVPVICTHTGGNLELIEHGVSGYLYPVGNVCTLAHLLFKVLTSPDQNRDMIDVAYRRLVSMCDRDTMIRSYQKVYQDLLR